MFVLSVFMWEICEIWGTICAVAYCSFYGKKVDPEPGRCRRTDGKKWRCSKDAYPDSKYCERHMHRGRNRSRKPVESQTMTQTSSTVTSLTATGSSSSGTGSFHGLPLNALSNSQGNATGTSQPHYPLDSIPYGIPSKDYRYLINSHCNSILSNHMIMQEFMNIHIPLPWWVQYLLMKSMMLTLSLP